MSFNNFGDLCYVFMDKNFAHQQSFLLYEFKNVKQLFEFDGWLAQANNIIYIAEIKWIFFSK